MKRLAIPLVLLVAIGVTWRYPLFHIKRLAPKDLAQNSGDFDATRFAETFWNQRLLKALDDWSDAAAVVDALREDSRRAAERYGRTVGVSRARLLCVRGRGTIVSIEEQGIGIAVHGEGASPDVVLRTGLLFGNTVRDAGGLLSAGDFSNSQHFNDVSTQLNRIVEAQVIAPLKTRAQLGRPITFVGCGQLLPDSESALPLRLIPLQFRIE